MPDYTESEDYIALLPPEIFILILEKIRAVDFFTLTMVSKYLHNMMYSSYTSGVNKKNNNNYFPSGFNLHFILNFFKELLAQYQHVNSKHILSFKSDAEKNIIKATEFLQRNLSGKKRIFSDDKQTLIACFFKRFIHESIDEKFSDYISQENTDSDFLFVLRKLYSSDRLYNNIINFIVARLTHAINTFLNKKMTYKMECSSNEIDLTVEIINGNVFLNYCIKRSDASIYYHQRNLMLDFNAHISVIPRTISAWLIDKIDKKDFNDDSANFHKVSPDSLKGALKGVLRGVGLMSNFKKTVQLLEKQCANKNTNKKTQDKREGYLKEYIEKNTKIFR